VIGIVGGGISGLALGAFLEERGVEHRVLEATDRPGGVIRTTTSAGRILEHGPQRTRVTPALRQLVSLAGLDDEVVGVPSELPLFIFRDGRLRRVPLEPAGFLRTDLLSIPGKVRILLEPFTRGPSPGETVEGFLTRKLGSEAYRTFLGPLFGGIFAQDPSDMYLRHALKPLLESVGVSRSLLVRAVARALSSASPPPVISFRDGLEALTRGLLGRSSSRIRLDTRVERLERDGEEGVGWVLRTSRQELRCDGVVLTVPAAEAARLLRAAAPEAAGRLARLRYNRLAIAHLLSDCPLEGLGYQVAFGEELRTRGVTWNASALGRAGVNTAFLGGSRDPGVLDLSDGEIGRIAAEEFREVTGWKAEVLGVSRTWIPAWDRSWTALEGLSLPPGIRLFANYESRVGIPGRVEGALALATELAEGL